MIDFITTMLTITALNILLGTVTFICLMLFIKKRSSKNTPPKKQ